MVPVSSLVKKTIKGKQYYYIVDSKRIDGKPKIVNQVYIGSVEAVIESLKESKAAVTPVYSEVLDFGAIAALYDVAQRLDVVGRIDAIAPKRNQGLSVGTYLLIAAINRAVNPLAKAGIEKWYAGTILSKLIPVSKNQLDSRRFWDNMDRLSEDDMAAFEAGFVPFLIKEYQLDTKCLVYDATNFFTYINTSNEKSELAKRGHCKAKRNDLRIIGLSLMLSGEDEIPLFYETYEGNRPDSKQFAVAVTNLKRRYKDMFGTDPDITLVFDRGNNSADNVSLLYNEKGEAFFHYVGGLKANQCKELYDIRKQDYKELVGEEFGQTKACRKRIEAFGREITAVITDNPELTRGQLQGVLENCRKCCIKLEEYQEKLQKWESGDIKKGKKPTRVSAEKKVADILSGEYMKRLFSIEWFEEEKRTYPYFSYCVSEEKLAELEEHDLGKSVLFTDHDEWSNEQIVHAYRSAWRIEAAFRQMKNPEHLTVRPLWHWTDQKIKVHIFCCILAYRLCCILKRELRNKGIAMGINELLERLSDKKQVISYYQKKRGLRESHSTTLGDPVTEEIVKLQGLEQYILKS